MPDNFSIGDGAMLFKEHEVWNISEILQALQKAGVFDNNTDAEVKSILDSMYKQIMLGEVSETDAMGDAIDLIKHEVGYDDEN